MCTPPGSIYTVDDDDSTADCMLVENGEILAIGNTGMPHFLSLVCLI
jgi:predicted amidohydrolase YtcJ